MTRGSGAVLLECMRVTDVRMVAIVCDASEGVGVMAIVSLLMFEGKDVEAESIQ